MFPDYSEFERTGSLFIHVPKSAGASTWQAIYGRQLTAHVRDDTYRIVFPRRVLDSLFSFAVVRHPWTRARSAYEFTVRRGHPSLVDFASQQLDRFEDFSDFAVNGLHRPEIIRHRLFCPQMEYIALSGDSKPALDFVGRFESLHEDIALIRERLNLGPAEMPHINKGQFDDAVLSSEVLDAVARAYARDISALGYSPPG